MAKSYTRYVCQECGKTTSRMFGRCPSCESWDSMIEELVEAEPAASSKLISVVWWATQKCVRWLKSRARRKTVCPCRWKSSPAFWVEALCLVRLC